MNEKFYENTRWRKKREKILKRDKYLCQDCKRYGRHTAAQVVHHIKPYEFFPEFAFDDKNLISLCNGCHNKRHPERAHKELWRERQTAERR